MDPWWNPAVGDQAADRAHRIGQNKPVLSIESSQKYCGRKILELQKKKRKIRNSLIGYRICYLNNKEELLLFEIGRFLMVKDKNDCFVHLFFDNIGECG